MLVVHCSPFTVLVDWHQCSILISYAFITKTPIICGREPAATEEEKKLGVERSAELSTKVNQVVLETNLSIIASACSTRYSYCVAFVIH